MKYKLLLTGSNQTLINDFFNHMDFSFECMYSSVRNSDITCHLKYYHPDAVVFCLHKDYKSDISGFGGVLPKLAAEKISLVIVGEDQNCELFEKTLPMAVDLSVRMPITTKGLEEEIFFFLERVTAQKEEERKREEALKQEQLQAEKENSGEKDGTEEKKHILVVDDDSGVLKMVKGYLGGQYSIATAISGKVALKFLEKKKTDLILLDYEMPGQNGAQVLQKIRSNEELKNLPVVFLTGMADPERIRQVLAYKPQGYLLKPIDANKLSETLDSILK